MKNFFEYLSTFLIAFSYTFLIRNHVYFGISLGTGTLILVLLNASRIRLGFTEYNFKPFFFFGTIFLITSLNSFMVARSIAVFIYLTLIIIFSFLLYISISKNKIIKERLLSYFVLSIFMNLLIVTIYNFINWDAKFIDTSEIKRFKGYLNILTILVLIIPFIKKSKLNILSYLLLIPNLWLSNCNSAILGVFVALIALSVFYFYQNIFRFKILFYALFFITLTLSSQILLNLPKNLDEESIQTQKFIVPTFLIDAHRQYIWSFSLKKISEKPLLGYGPDTSNFIEGSQEIIGSKYTGTMPFIPSHPHNFLLEIILDNGIIGLIGFIIFIFYYNFQIFRKSDDNGKFLLILFFFYFWGSSLVNFSFWLGWWQVSYFFITALISSINLSKNKKT
jgi:O-antigen ligase